VSLGRLQHCRCMLTQRARRYYIIPTSPEMQLKVRNKLHEKESSSGSLADDELENQAYVFSDVGASGAERPPEGSRVRFVLDKARGGSFRALVILD
jgi:hypothetical protein